MIQQSNTQDTIIEFVNSYNLDQILPILFLGTLPYIIRQGLQAKMLMPEYKVDVATIFSPYLETYESELKGDLPLHLYMDEIHWLLCALMRSQK